MRAADGTTEPNGGPPSHAGSTDPLLLLNEDGRNGLPPCGLVLRPPGATQLARFKEMVPLEENNT